MAYVKRMVCFAKSYKTGGSCIAGKEVESGVWIRPISDRPTEELTLSEYCYSGNEVPKLLDIIDVPLSKASPHNHQTENHIISKERWKKRGTLSWEQLEDLCDEPEALWANTDSTKGGGIYDCMSPEVAAKFDYSLLLIKRKQFTVRVETSTWEGRTRTSYRGKFKYKGVNYIFRITDPAVSSTFQSKGVGDYPLTDVYLCLSLTEKYEADGRCHKLIAAVFTNPPL